MACESELATPIHVRARLTILANLSPAGSGSQRVFVYTSLSASDSSTFVTPAGLRVEITDQSRAVTIRLDSVRSFGRVFFPIPEGFLVAGHDYNIIAVAPGFDPVQAITRIPEQSSIRDLAVQGLTISPSDKQEIQEILRYSLTFRINHAGDNRYYHLIFYNEYEGRPGRYFIVNPEPTDEQIFLPHYDTGILLDRNNLRADAQLDFTFVDWIIENQRLKRVYVELRSISEEYFRYHSTLARQLIVRQDPFAEPISIFNNIQGGYGNFSGFNPYIGSSALPE